MRALAWALFGVVAVLAPTCAALGIAGDQRGLILPEDRSSMLPQALIIAVASFEFAVVGLLIARRQQSNPIGWIFLGSGALLALVGSAYGYADLALYEAIRTLSVESSSMLSSPVAGRKSAEADNNCRGSMDSVLVLTWLER